MADRSVKVRLEADVKGYVAGIRTAVKATEDFGKRASGYITKHRDSINDVSNVALGAGAVLTGFAAVAVKSAADFDEAMSSVQAATMAPADEMERLREAAIDAGASTKYSATEAAAAIEELAKAGVSTADILNGGLSGALNLAASDNIAVAEAAEIASSAMTQFGLAGEDVTHIADLLAAGAGKAQGGVSELGMALSQAGLVASQTGLSIEETVGGLTAFAAAGLMGSDAGTSFKSMLQALNNPSAKARKEMDALGISMYDSQGEFIGLSALAGELETAMADLTPEQRNAAMAVIFGSDAVRAANVLYSEGEAGIRDWIAAVDDQGFAAEQAAARMDNLKGDLEELSGALETAFIGAGDGANSALRPLVQNLTEVINLFNDLSPTAQSALGTGAGIAGLSLLAIGGLGKAIVAANDLKLAMTNLGIATDTTSKKMKLLGVGSAVGLAITALTLTIGHFISESAEARSNAELLAESFDELTGAATADTDKLILDQLNDSLSKADWDKLKELGFTYEEVVNAIKEGGPALDELNDKIFANQTSLSNTQEMKGYEDSLKSLRGSANDAADAYELSREQLALTEDQMGSTGDQAEDTAAQQEILQAAVEETGVALDGVIADLQTFLDLLFETGLATMSARDAQAAYHESVDQVGETVDELIEKHGGLGTALNDAKTDFDLTTEAGREANSAFQDVARSGMDVATSMSEAGASQDEIQGKLSTTYDDLILAANQLGITGDAAEDLARDVMGIPDGVEIDTWMSDEAERQARDTQNALNGIDRYIEIVTQYVTRGTRPPVGNRGAPVPTPVYATGGAVYGPGTGTSDSIHARLSNGEHVWTAREVAAAGGHSEVYRLRKAALAGVQGFAEGGPVLRPMEYVPARQSAPGTPGVAGTPVSIEVNARGLNAHEVAVESRAQMQHVVRSQVPILARR